MIIPLVQFPAWRKDHSEVIILVGGCFDVLHFGHVQFLKAAKDLGGKLFVALESDEFIRVHKKREPVHIQKERAAILAALRMVDGVILLPYLATHQEYGQFVQDVRPNIIAVTGGDPKLLHTQNRAEEVGAQVKVVTERIGNHSSSSLLKYDKFY